VTGPRAYRKDVALYNTLGAIPVAARSKEWVFGRLLPGIAGSNPAGRMDVSRKGCVWAGRGV
jgi:hypothetical protein